MIDSDIHLKLLANVPIDVGVGQFQLPSIKQVIEMGESKYQQYLSMLTFTKSMIDFGDESTDGLSDFQIMGMLCFHSPFHREVAYDSFKLFLNKELKVTLFDEEYIIYFDDLSNTLTEEKWEFIKKIACIGNFIQESKEEEYKAGNDEAKRLIDFIKNKNKSTQKKQEQINLHSILSAVSWRTNGIDSLLNKTIYQLYDGFYRLRFVDNYNQIFTGIYTGNVDQTKIKLPDIDWANIIKIN